MDASVCNMGAHLPGASTHGTSSRSSQPDMARSGDMRHQLETETRPKPLAERVSFVRSFGGDIGDKVFSEKELSDVTPIRTGTLALCRFWDTSAGVEMLSLLLFAALASPPPWNMPSLAMSLQPWSHWEGGVLIMTRNLRQAPSPNRLRPDDSGASRLK